MSDCVLCAWTFNPLDAPWAAYPPGSWLPLRWGQHGPVQVGPEEGLAETIPSVATVGHWAREHPELLLAAYGPFDQGVIPRWSF